MDWTYGPRRACYYKRSNWPAEYRPNYHPGVRPSRITSGRSSARPYVRMLTKVICRMAGAACTKLDAPASQRRSYAYTSQPIVHTLASPSS